MGAYIIRCKNKEELSIFLSKGFVGIKASSPNSNDETSKKDALKQNYSIIRDLKPAREGDLVFLQIDNHVYGAFKLTSEFLEHPNTPIEYKSEFLRYHPPFPCWNNHSFFPEASYFWQAGIESVEGKSFSGGVKIQKSFEMKKHGTAWNLPDRFDYKKNNKVMHPITSFEVEELISLLAQHNSGQDTAKVVPKKFEDFKPINLNFSVDKYGFLEDKSVIESWLFDNMVIKKGNKSEYKNILETLGTLHHSDAQIPDFYLDFMEVFPYLAKVQKKDVFQVIDINTQYLDKSYFLQTLPKLIRYAYSLVDKVSKGNLKGVQISLIAKGFHPYLFDYIKARNMVEPGNPVHLIKYEVYKRLGKN
ncbi:hypothetical protein FJZ53_04160, partial [Candidatus Woesearchaeota archaeon]|nr:hypothetical protein [Candidatus Woesearchaeota archaeon]